MRIQEHMSILWANYDINNYYKIYGVCLVLTTSLHFQVSWLSSFTPVDILVAMLCVPFYSVVF